MRTIKSNLKEVLKERGLTQKELAEKIEVREATISELCNNKLKLYPREVLSKIAEELDIDDINSIITIKKEDGSND
ncbi:helix-turn-helix domain-containing protein [Evansella halocellulosilytica]|uniref:helix-turn-helix domain-containing protein n=1 Tax=Evansella halocellulosilytica TaxID=2011013 RepID=UPI000BB9018B|nr:helix-turn-helix transcriptional regulator [Evansella halocellulosilytica]